jgi:methionyl-tRNA formyltransferase
MKILFLGKKKYAAEMLQWTVVEMKQAVVGVVTDNHNSPIAVKANELNIPVISIEQAEYEFVSNKNYADLVISYLYWKKIKESFISTPKSGCINFHPQPLPDWKGVGGYNVAILRKLKEWGASAHYVDKEIDTGKIIRVYKFNFDYRYETAKSLVEKTQRIMCDLYRSVITDIINGNIKESELIPNIGGTYISRKQMIAMLKINPAIDDIALKCHAFWFPPWGATIELQGKEYTIIDDFILSQIKALES